MDYNVDFVILPKYAFRALSTWYPCNRVLRRGVLKKAADGAARKASAVDQFFRRRVAGVEYELEMFPTLLYFDRITEAGEKTHSKGIVNLNIDMNYI